MSPSLYLLANAPDIMGRGHSPLPCLIQIHDVQNHELINGCFLPLGQGPICYTAIGSGTGTENGNACVEVPEGIWVRTGICGSPR